MTYPKTIEDIKNLSHYREFTCRHCSHPQRVYILRIHGTCEQCGARYKFRGIGPIGSEIEDVVDAVLQWMGQGKELAEAMEWKEVLDSGRGA